MSTIKVDLDGLDRRKWRRHMRRLGFLIRQANSILDIGLKPELVATTTKGYHLIMETGKALTRRETIIIQLVMGSDPIRGILNLYRVQRNWRFWNVLFTEKRKWRGDREIKGSREVRQPKMLRELRRYL